jgi:tRNA G18 (ribose-2'-O)-methylase SpoU
VAIKSYSIAVEKDHVENANVADLYKNWNQSEIRADLDSRRTDLVSITMNLTKDFNKASVIRGNNAYLGKAVYIVGRRKYNKRGAVGTYHYEHVYSADTLAEVVELLRTDGYRIFAVDNLPEHNPTNIWDVTFPSKSAFVYGEEQRGLQPEEIALCDEMVFVQMYGSVRSLNIAQCAAVVMNEYSRQHRR